ncbi:MAG: GNAT family N-acetyltransferase [Desulfosalsimonadaceae bacterium]
MNSGSLYSAKTAAPEEAVKKIKIGSSVFIGTGCGEPQQLIRAMVADPGIQDVFIYQMLSATLADYVHEPHFTERFYLKLFFISPYMRQAAFEGKIDYLPVYLSQIPELFYSRQVNLDVALVQVSPPDEHGFCCLGISVDITLAGLRTARTVIAQVNPNMPKTWGDSHIHVDDIDCLVYYEEPLVEFAPTVKNQEVVERIAHYLIQLIDDGATLQVGFGHLPDAVLPYLKGKKDLGIHTQVITDGMLALLRQKVITNKKKTLLGNRIVTSLCMGSKDLYKYVDDNPLFYFRSSEYVSDPNVIARNDNLISLSSALEVDLTGQACSDSRGYLFYSGIGDQVDFTRGSKMSKDGFSIIALPSTAENGKVSRIVSHLSEGAGIATIRGDVDVVVTEYGIAELHGKGIYQRVMELAQIAHPKFRETLINEAKKRHYIFADQVPPSRQDLIFLDNYKFSMELANGKSVEFRPLLSSDEFGVRNFLYSLRDQSIYYRFFQPKRVFKREMLQKQWATVDYRKNMSIVGLAQRGKHKEIIAIASYYGEGDSDKAEVAFLVKEEYQGMGIAGFLLEILEKIAKENCYTAFTATVIRENAAMRRVFQKRYPNAELYAYGREIEIRMPF